MIRVCYNYQDDCGAVEQNTADGFSPFPISSLEVEPHIEQSSHLTLILIFNGLIFSSGRSENGRTNELFLFYLRFF